MNISQLLLLSLQFPKMINPIDFLAKRLPTHKLDIFGFDSLMYYSFPYYLYSALVIIFTIWSGHPAIILFIIYGLIPLLDEFFSLDQKNPTEKERQQLQKSFKFSLALYFHVITDWICFFMILEQIRTYEVKTLHCFLNLLLNTFTLSSLLAGEFAIAHQIFHRNDLFHRILGTIHMSKNLYIHFTYNHIYIHHKKVATPQDPASAQKYMSIYQFFPKSFFGSYKVVYYHQSNKGIPFYLNYAVLSVLQAIIFPLLILKFYGFQTTLIFSISAFISIVYLEGINYIEHYGLRRKKLNDGSYQKTTIMHSWNAPHRISNYLLFKLQRHSDHHQNCLKPYQTLASLPQSPMLPHGYTTMIILCFVPHKFFMIMNPLLPSQQDNLKPEQKILAYKKAQLEAKRFIIECALLFGGICMILQV